MNKSEYKQAAEELYRRRTHESAYSRLAQHLRPDTTKEALEIHKEMVSCSGGKVFGWKCLKPLSPEKLVFAPLLLPFERGNTCQAWSEKGQVRIEPEISFQLSADLPARAEGYAVAEIDRVIGKAHLALELVQQRFRPEESPSHIEKLADGLSNQGQYLGPEIDLEIAKKLAEVQVTITQGGVEQVYGGVHPDGEASEGLYWLINYLSEEGVSLEAGQSIITGSLCGAPRVDFDKLTTVKYEGLGEVHTVFEQRS